MFSVNNEHGENNRYRALNKTKNNNGKYYKILIFLLTAFTFVNMVCNLFILYSNIEFIIFMKNSPIVDKLKTINIDDLNNIFEILSSIKTSEIKKILSSITFDELKEFFEQIDVCIFNKCYQ